MFPLKKWETKSFIYFASDVSLSSRERYPARKFTPLNSVATCNLIIAKVMNTPAILPRENTREIMLPRVV